VLAYSLLVFTHQASLLDMIRTCTGDRALIPSSRSPEQSALILTGEFWARNPRELILVFHDPQSRYDTIKVIKKTDQPLRKLGSTLAQNECKKGLKIGHGFRNESIPECFFAEMYEPARRRTKGVVVSPHTAGRRNRNKIH
jgi:hypothetical protein